MYTNDFIKSINNRPHWKVLSWNHAKFEYYAYRLFSNFEVELIILLLPTEAEMKNLVAYKNQNVYLKTNI